MRVIHILDHSIPLESRYAARTLSILKAQRALGWETFPLTGPHQGPGTGNEEEIDGWRFQRTVPPGGILEGVPVLAEIELMGEVAYGIERLARRVRPQVLHAHAPMLNLIPALWVARRLRIPVVYDLRGSVEDAADGRSATPGHFARALETWAIRRTDAITIAGEDQRRDLVARGVSGDKVAVLPEAAGLAESPAGNVCGEAGAARYDEVYSRLLRLSLRP